MTRPGRVPQLNIEAGQLPVLPFFFPGTVLVEIVGAKPRAKGKLGRGRCALDLGPGQIIERDMNSLLAKRIEEGLALAPQPLDTQRVQFPGLADTDQDKPRGPVFARLLDHEELVRFAGFSGASQAVSEATAGRLVQRAGRGREFAALHDKDGERALRRPWGERKT